MNNNLALLLSKPTNICMMVGEIKMLGRLEEECCYDSILGTFSSSRISLVFDMARL